MAITQELSEITSYTPIERPDAILDFVSKTQHLAAQDKLATEKQTLLREFSSRPRQEQQRIASLVINQIGEQIKDNNLAGIRQNLEIAKILEVATLAYPTEELQQQAQLQLQTLETLYPAPVIITPDQPLPVEPTSVTTTPSRSLSRHRRITRRGFLVAAAKTGLSLAGAALLGGGALALAARQEVPTYDRKKILKTTPTNVPATETVGLDPTVEPTVTVQASPTNTPTAIPTETASPTATSTITPTAEPTGKQPDVLPGDVQLSPTTTPEPKPDPTSEPEPTSEPTAEPTPDPKKQAQAEIKDKNAGEYFLGDLVKLFKEARAEKWNNDPAFRERVEKEFFDSDAINFLYLGTDDTRGRFNEFPSENGFGRSDVMMLIRINPHNFKVTAITFPRDMYAPEPSKFMGVVSRINTITRIPLLSRKADAHAEARKMIETATGIPVDGVIQTNIDFMKGSSFWDARGQLQEGPPGVFERLYPEGLQMHISRRVHDTEYPEGYAFRTIDFQPNQPGETTLLSGPQVVEYARSRHSDSDYGRNDAQREVLIAAAKQFAPEFLKQLAMGNTDKLDTLIAFLEEQQEIKNMFSDVDVVEIMKTVRDSIQDLRNTPMGMIKLGLIAKNSLGALSALWKNPSAASFTMGLDKMINNAGRGGADPWLTKVAGSAIGTAPTKLGNYIEYWSDIRAHVKSEFTSWKIV